MRPTRRNPQTHGRWTFDGLQGVYESATRDKNGNAVTFSCNDLGESGRLWIELGGKPIAGGIASIDIDGSAFEVVVMADAGRVNTDCRVCAETYVALWEATAAGNLMTVTASDGNRAAFSLRGSRDALGYTPCRPADGY